MKIFDSISARKPKRNKFDLSHERKMSMKMGYLYPMYLDEIVPGDSFRVRSEILMRLAPMLAPVMHRINVFTHYFFVPNRLVWDNWETFITGGPDGNTVLPVPALNTYDDDESWPFAFVKGMLPDYFGVPVWDGVTPLWQDLNINALPFRAYQLIYNEYYRDQNLTDPIDFSKGDTCDIVGEWEKLTNLRYRAWEKDYFTSALPWAQRGGSVEVPGNVKYLNQGIAIDSAGNPIENELSDTIVLDALGGINRSDDGSSVAQQMNIKNLDAFGININDLRASVRLQEWLEKNARGGARYIEQILSHFGVKSSDARLQRPEYLGGAINPVMISEVLSTVGTDAAGIEAPQANMAGHGISIGNINGFKKTFEEHGYVIGIISVLPKTSYETSLERTFLKRDKFDFYWPEFAHLGEQEIKKGELFLDWYDQTEGKERVNYETWAYQSRYSEYKYKPSTIHGDFRDNLNFWHMSRTFSALPPLNTSFVEADVTKRIFAVEDQDVDNLYVQIYNKVDALRPMPYYGTPML